MKILITILKTIGLIFLSIAGFFYLFILPGFVASGLMELNTLSIGFGLFMLIQLWMLIAEYTFEVSSAVFSFKRKSLFKFIYVIDKKKSHKEILKSKTYVLFISILAYVFMIYGFGVIYTFISKLNSAAFNIGKLSLFEGVYYSFITSSTVGFGDIHPLRTVSRVFTMIQISTSMFYLLVILTSVVGFIQEKTSNKDNDPKH